MTSWGSYSYVFTPVVALLVVGVLALVLRWSSARGRSVVQRPGRDGGPDEYGLLVPVAEPGTFIEAEVARATLEHAGLQATVATTTSGPAVMVFRKDVEVARSVLRAGPGGQRSQSGRSSD